jgi:NADPH-dependent 2,4-dienoyl-CoA reductase/sulfur reductase-like enzyme/nitrite reductase/ring-hydroxylating ferredoxin subunit
MSGGDAKLTGPDLAAEGIAADALRPGEKMLAHAFGDPVLVARLVDDYTAIGASCTHYGGPLAEGEISGEVVRCPWHHACFNLRTGEATRAPALNPVACYELEHRGDRIFATRKIERDPLTTMLNDGASAAATAIVIVGAGAAGSAAAEMLRRTGYAGSVTMIDSDESAPYDRPNLSKDYLAGNAPEEWIPIRPEGFYAEHRITVKRANVSRIDTTAKRVELDGGEGISYDRLLLATGADPIHLPIDGAELPHVHYLRSLKDSRGIIEAAKSAKRAVVIGGSFIGLEAAASLRNRELEVHVVAPEALPLERILGNELGTFIQSLHEEKGVNFHLGHKPAKIEADGVTLDDGTKLPADLVVIGVGVRPRLALAEQAGLAMDKGVSVNEYLETSVSGVFAAGDIARWPDPHTGDRIRVEHWVVAQRMGQTAAKNMLGEHVKFDFVPFFWSAHYDVSINYVGHAESWDTISVQGNPSNRDAAVRYEKDGKVLALATIFRDEESLTEEIAMERHVQAS